MKTPRSSSTAARRRQSDAPALDTPPPAQEEPFEPAADVPRYQSFTVRFLIEPGGGCRRTEVSYVQGGASETWAGYDLERLAQWIAGYVRPIADSKPQPAQEIKLALRELEVLADAEQGSQHLAAAGQPLKARMVLDLAGAAGHPPVAYTATVYARGLCGESWQIGEARGHVPAGEATAVEVLGMAKQPGLYRVGATVALGTASSDSETLVGGLLQVYEGAEGL
jgi:hypothetical protein